MTDNMTGYVLGQSGKNEATRYKKAEKIIAIIEEHKPLTGTEVLEVGTGAGYIAHAISRHAKRVDSVDIVDDRKITEGYKQTIVPDETLPFPDKSFDVVITNHVLEHVPNQQKHMSEMRRVLKDDGLIYLASPNKWWLTDPHYKLPFISWLPRPVSGLYLRLVKQRKWDIYSVSLLRLNKLARANGLMVNDQTWTILRSPAKYHMKLPVIITTVARLTPRPIARLLSAIMPTHLKILTPSELV
jgi:2-polyprenyl-3-methyl-5-hydroxy-6-metoxy-1,4-benzoquinol methylase